MKRQAENQSQNESFGEKNLPGFEIRNVQSVAYSLFYTTLHCLTLRCNIRLLLTEIKNHKKEE